ncbi:MAG: peptidylprolyl isomerase [Thermoanaerobaculales bacterium]|jgi:peptidyl-prolyl cis-trans isomerase C|nr:peptidylprolyl isomerase [Thermoanaerobaculales bacterium]
MRSIFIVVAVAGLAAAAPCAGQATAELAPQVDPTTPSVQAQPTPAPNPVILRVNGDPIYAVEISMLMQTIQVQLDDRGQPVDPHELAKIATQRAVEQKLVIQEARRFGIRADELEVARAAQVAEQQAGGRALLEAKLRNTGSNYDQFLGMIREIEIMKAFIGGQIAGNVVVTEQEIAEYYAANPTLFDADERVHAYHMIFIVGEDADPAVLQAKRTRAEAARQRALTSGEDFTTVARELSEGPSAPTGGDLGWVTRDKLVKQLADAVFGLEPGAISEVVQSRFGFHVATISDKRPAERISLEAATPQIEDFLRQQKASEAVATLIKTLAATAKVENVLAGDDLPVGGTG